MRTFVLMLVLALLLIVGCKTAIDVIVGPPEEPAPQPPAAPEPAAPAPQPTPPPAAPSLPVQPPATNVTLNASNASVQGTAAPAPGVHTILIKNDGFEPKLLKIKAGGMVIWKNTRTAAIQPQTSLVIGARLCRELRSPKLESEESFNHTFPTPLTCEYADGIYTRQGGVIVVE